jgi:hypothetical protein
MPREKYQEKDIERIKRDLLDRSDGPVNRFSVIIRATRMAAEQITHPDDIAEALEECIEELIQSGDLSSNEFEGRANGL